MGLDMQLNGEKYHWSYGDKKPPEVDGFRVKETILELGYWRKHPNLHGFIVNTFANGVDECQRIDLGPDQIRKIIQATIENNLPETTGFFFGVSTKDRDEETIIILRRSLEWLETSEPDVSRSIFYKASW